MYLTFEEYQNMGGTLDFPLFDELAFEAESQINWWTFNRLKKFTTIPKEVKRCMFSIIRYAQRQQSLLEITDGGANDNVSMSSAIASQSNDGVSTSYNVVSADKLVDLIKHDSGNVIQRYLNGVKDSLGRPVLYRGLYWDE